MTATDVYNASLSVLKRLRRHGFKALFAGGCVRDKLLGLAPKDFDIATDARPENVLEVFPRARQVGAAFGVMLVRRAALDVEVATFRADGVYHDGRHPQDVTFGNEIEDANRRDFTVNGLFHDPIGDTVIDHVGGKIDIEKRLLRAIGDPSLRFAEDHLRMLRAVRIAARLGFTIEPDTLQAIRDHAPSLRRISAERVSGELERILVDPSRVEGWRLLRGTGLVDHLSCAWRPTTQEQELTATRLQYLPEILGDVTLPLAAAFCDCAADQIPDIARSLRLSNRISRDVGWLLRALLQLRDEKSLDLAGLKTLMSDPNWPSALPLLRAHLRASSQDSACADRIELRARDVTEVAPPPILDGHDLKRMGVPAGPQFGSLIDAVYRAQLNEQVTNREDAENLVRQLLDSSGSAGT